MERSVEHDLACHKQESTELTKPEFDLAPVFEALQSSTSSNLGLAASPRGGCMGYKSSMFFTGIPCLNVAMQYNE